MRARRALAAMGVASVAVGALALIAACSSKVVSSEFGPVKGDERTFGVGAEMPGAAVDVRNDRLAPHDGVILANMHFVAVYVGAQGDDMAPSADTFLSWIGPSSYWAIMRQYGVNAATYDGAVQLATDVVFPASSVDAGLVPFPTFEARIHELVHGVDGGAPLLPHADGYAFFLPNGINIDSGENAGIDLVTCVTSTAYHAYDGEEPYAVFPPCDDGRSTAAISHELTEMATDPILRKGWASDESNDIKNGAEIADVCYRAVMHPADGYDVAELWSNADGDCLPK